MLHGSETATSCIHLNYSKVCEETKIQFSRRDLFGQCKSNIVGLLLAKIVFLNGSLAGSFRGLLMNKDY